MTDTFWGNYSSALGAIEGVNNRVTSRRAGAQLADGDYGQAANTLFGAGNLDGGRTLQSAGVAEQTRQREETARTHGQQLAFTRQALKALKDSPDPLTEFDRMVPAFRQLGTEDAQIGQLRQGLETGGRQFLDTIQQVVDTQERELSFQKAGDRLLVFEEGNPTPVNDFAPALEPIEVDGVLVDPVTFQPLVDTREPKIQTIQNSDGSSSIVQIDQPAPVSGVSRSAASPGSGGGPGFGTREEVLAFIAPIVGDFRPSSGERSREEQDALIARGATSAYNSAHVNGLGQDIVPSAPREQWEQIANDLRATGRFGRVLVESGNGRNQGTGPHIHLEPRVGGSGRDRPSATTGGVRVVAQGANNGPTPAAARADARESRVAERQSRTDARQLRRDFESQDGVKEYETVRSSYNRLRALAANGSATDDTAVGFEFMKMLDPTSVVRESEYALVGQSQGIGGQALVALQRLSTGQRLTPELRRNLVETGERVFQGRQARYNELVQQYRGYAEEDGFDPDRVVPLRGAQASGQGGGLVAAPGLRFQITPQQLQRRQAVVSSGGRANDPLGGPENPYYINPRDPNGSYANVPTGRSYVTPDGTVRTKR